MAKARLIYTDVPGALPAEFVLPPDLDLEISSVYARLSGAAAAGSFRPCLTVLSQAGNLIARVPLDETYAVGDTGDATWSPFLRSVPAASGGGLTNVPWARISRGFGDAAQVIGNNSFTEIDCVTSVNVASGQSGNGVFTVDLTDNTITVVNAGLVMVRAFANWFSSITNNWIVWVSNSEVANLNYLRSGGGISTTAQDELMFLTRVPSGTSFTPGVWQIDGANRSLDAGFLELHYLGTYTGTDYASLDPDVA